MGSRRVCRGNSRKAGNYKVGKQKVGKQKVGKQKVGKQKVGKQKVGKQKVGNVSLKHCVGDSRLCPCEQSASTPTQPFSERLPTHN
ncbi:MAG: hypothetical protein LBL62_09715 [Planctomycetaceae bacterium]|jgi:hypothetical protein|nr:hypothetical protein [Planctomycetaceae bacterium]